MTLNPFEYLDSINTTKKNLIRESDNPELAEKEYNAFMVNRGLSYFSDTVSYANEMNLNSHVDNILQYEFLINTVRPRKRFSKWSKSKRNDDLEVVKEYFSFSNTKAEQALEVLTQDQIDEIRKKLEKGGN